MWCWASAKLDCAGLIEAEPNSKRFTFWPGPNWLSGQHVSQTRGLSFFVTSTPDAFEAIGGDELLYDDGQPRAGAYLALRSRPVRELSFAVVGSMTDAEAAERACRQISAWRRRCEPASTRAAPLGTSHQQPPDQGWWGRRTRHAVPVARAQRDDSSDCAAWASNSIPGAAWGNARRLPGAGRVLPGVGTR